MTVLDKLFAAAGFTEWRRHPPGRHWGVTAFHAKTNTCWGFFSEENATRWLVGNSPSARRAYYSPPPPPPTRPRKRTRKKPKLGVCALSALTPAQVREVRRIFKLGRYSPREIARRVGVGLAATRKVLSYGTHG